MNTFLLLTYFLAVAIPLRLALASRPPRKRTEDSDGVGAAAKDSLPEPGIGETVDALAAALRAGGDETTAEKLTHAFYGAATGGELTMGMRFVLGAIDRRKLQGDVNLLMRIERLLSGEVPIVRIPGKVIRQVNFVYTLLEDEAGCYVFELVIPAPEMAAIVTVKKVQASPLQKRLIQKKPQTADDIAEDLIREEKARQRQAWIDGSQAGPPADLGDF
jgi:hypothetical protein